MSQSIKLFLTLIRTPWTACKMKMGPMLIWRSGTFFVAGTVRKICFDSVITEIKSEIIIAVKKLKV